ncbi:MAG: hypothetical protein QOG30_3650 [Acidimicrobiaceae bacterium]
MCEQRRTHRPFGGEGTNPCLTCGVVVRVHEDLRFGVPLYTLAEAAKALAVPPSTFATWAKGYVRRPVGRKPVKGQPVVTALAAKSGEPSVPFVGLAEGMVLAAVRQARVPLQRVRPALEVLTREIV